MSLASLASQISHQPEHGAFEHASLADHADDRIWADRICASNNGKTHGFPWQKCKTMLKHNKEKPVDMSKQMVFIMARFFFLTYLGVSSAGAAGKTVQQEGPLDD